MGQKVNPNAMRLGINMNPDSSWYAEPKDYVNYISADYKLRIYLLDRLRLLAYAAFSLSVQHKMLELGLSVHDQVSSLGKEVQMLRI